MLLDTNYPNDYLTVRQAAELVGCCEKTIRNYIKAGRLRAKRRGPKIIVISLDDIHNVYCDFQWKRAYK